MRREAGSSLSATVEWFILGTGGWALGAVAGWFVEGRLLVGAFPNDMRFGWGGDGVFSVSGVLGALALGFITGGAQSEFLQRRYGVSPRSWIVRNGLAWALESFVLPYELFGLFLGLVQWRALRQRGAGFLVWPLTVWLMLEFAVRIVNPMVGSSLELVGGPLAVMTHGALWGLVYCLGTGPLIALAAPRRDIVAADRTTADLSAGQNL